MITSNRLNALFDSGAPVPFQSLAKAVETDKLEYQLGKGEGIDCVVDGRKATIFLRDKVEDSKPVTISERERQHNEKIRTKYGDKIGWEWESTTKPIDLPSPNPVAKPTKYKVKELAYSCHAWSDGGQVFLNRNGEVEPKDPNEKVSIKREKGLLTCFGSAVVQGKPTLLELEVLR